MAVTTRVAQGFYPAKSVNRNVTFAFVSLTLANGANPTVSWDDGNVVSTAVRAGEGNYTITLSKKATKVKCFANIQNTADSQVNCDAFTEGNAAAVVNVTTFAAGSADDLDAKVLDLLICFVAS